MKNSVVPRPPFPGETAALRGLSDREEELGWLQRESFAAVDRAICSEAAAPPEWDKWFQRLKDALVLEEGWNGDDAPPPEFNAALNATKFLKALHHADYQPTRIAASAMGGIAITRRVENKKVLVEFYNDGRVYYLFSDRTSGKMDVKPLMLDQGSLTRFIASMREFLNG